MSSTENYGIQSIPPPYDENNRYYIHTSEGYSRVLEEIDTEQRDIADTERIEERQQRLDSDEIERLEAVNRENEKRILEEIGLKEKQSKLQIADVAEYLLDDEALRGTNIDLLA